MSTTTRDPFEFVKKQRLETLDAAIFAAIYAERQTHVPPRLPATHKTRAQRIQQGLYLMPWLKDEPERSCWIIMAKHLHGSTLTALDAILSAPLIECLTHPADIVRSFRVWADANPDTWTELRTKMNKDYHNGSYLY